MIYRQQLAAMPLFAGLAPERIDRLCAQLTEQRLAPGEVLVREGDPGRGFCILIEGSLQITKLTGGVPVPAGRSEAPGFLGELPLLSGTPAAVTLQTADGCLLLRMADDAFRELIATDTTFGHTIFQTLYRRVAGLESFVRQREKMASLGTLAAGLAHELNNPAAAVARATDRMHSLLGELDAVTCALHGAGVPEPVMDALLALRNAATVTAPMRTPMQESDREEAFGDWLEQHRVPDPWHLASALATSAIDVSDLEPVAATLGAGLAPGMRWLCNTVEMAALVDEAGRGAARVSDLVAAMKSYSYMDQAPRQQVDVHAGIEDTLTIMRHKLKHGVAVVRRYDSSLPRIPVFGSELNQVWTNLIDNAADAMDGKGTLTVTTRRDGGYVVVEIGDDGPGITPEVQARLFETFFTTKPPGKGTGLGLDITWRIVVNRHGGGIRVESKPGDTRFLVSLPITPAGGPAG